MIEQLVPHKVNKKRQNLRIKMEQYYYLHKQVNMIENAQQTNSIPFLQAFTHTSIHPDLPPFQSQSFSSNFGINLISNLWIDFLPTSQNLPEDLRYYKLNKKIALYLHISQSPIAITNIGIFSKPPDGWQPLEYPTPLNNQTDMKICVKKSKAVLGMSHVDSISICQSKQYKMKLQTTQPTLNQNDECQADELYLEEFGLILLIKKTKICIQSCEKAYFKPFSSPLILNTEIKNIDLQTLSYLCYPKGVRVFTKPSGFKIYNFILTLESGQRLYCYCLAFRQKCEESTQQRLCKMFNLTQGRQFYVEKTFSLISEFCSTDQLHLCMEAIYKIYLSSSEKQFQICLKNLPKIFTKDLNSNLCRFQSKILNINWKLNSSYPTVSNHAIYSVFKFLSVDNIIELMEGLLLQSKIFFISDCKNILGYSIQAFLSFIFPLKWVHVIISILPQATIDLVQAPMATIFGMSNCQATRIQQQFQNSAEALYVYLDKNTIVDKRQQKYPKLPKVLREGLKKRLLKFQAYDSIDVRDYLGNPENMSLFKTRETQDPSFCSFKIRNIFLELMIALLKDYEIFFIQEPRKQEKEEDERKSLKKIYNVADLKKFHKNSQFLKEFFDCGIFTQFIQCKYSQPTNKWIKLFDRACRKIIKVQNNQMIQQESEYAESSEQQEQKMPKGCLSMINMFSKESEQQKSPNKRKSSHKQTQKKEQRMIKTEVKKFEQQDNPEDNLQKQVQSQTTQQFNDKKIEQNMEKIVYVDQEEPIEGPAGHFCFFFTLPYRRIKSSKVAKKIGKSMKNFKKWFIKKKMHEAQVLQ